MSDIITLQIGIPGGPELLIVLVVLILLFGANKIPKLARSSGQAIGEFQRGRQELEEELKEMDEPRNDESTAGETTSERTTSERTSDTTDAEASSADESTAEDVEADEETEKTR